MNTEKEKLSKLFNLNSHVIDILFNRGYDTEEKITKFLNPSEKDIHDPFMLKDMNKAVARIKKAMEKKEKVLIFGDYDVDGVSASAILIKYFASKDFFVDYYLPNRYVDGYGLTNEVLDKVKQKYNPSLIITVDCGISCHDEIEYAKSIGIEIIVTDHHDIPEVLPETITINAKLKDQDYPFSQLCGTGVAFKLVQALSGLEEAKKYLGICALATIADIVPLLDENRALVTLGLKDFENNLPLGIKMLIKDNKLSYNLSASDIAFRLSPKINAAGRMGDPAVALRLYIKEDKKVLAKTIENLNQQNQERQSLCSIVYDDAIKMLKKINLSKYKAIVLYSKNWDSGILGIVSAKIAGEFNKPTILFSEVGDELKGSARSINDIDICSTIANIKEVVEAFGGHKMAAGLTIKTKHFSSFIRSLNESLEKNYKPEDFLSRVEYDFKLLPSEINEKLINDLDVLEPCGCGNPKPIFLIDFDKVNVSSMGNFPNHLNISAKNFNIVAFNSAEYMTLLKNTDKQSIAVELQISEFKGKKYLKGISKNIYTGKIVKPKNNDVIYGEYLLQLKETETQEKYYSEYNRNYFQKLVEDADKAKIGTLFVASTYESYTQFIEQFPSLNLTHNYFEITKCNAENSIIVSPISYDNFNLFSRVIFLDPILDIKYLNMVSTKTFAKLYYPQYKKVNNTIFKGLSCERGVFGIYYKMLSDLTKKLISFENRLDIFKHLKLLNPQVKKLSYRQFTFCLYTFIELNIFSIKQEGEYITLSEDSKVFSSLNKSSLYNTVNLILATS